MDGGGANSGGGFSEGAASGGGKGHVLEGADLRKVASEEQEEGGGAGETDGEVAEAGGVGGKGEGEAGGSGFRGVLGDGGVDGSNFPTGHGEDEGYGDADETDQARHHGAWKEQQFDGDKDDTEYEDGNGEGGLVANEAAGDVMAEEEQPEGNEGDEAWEAEAGGLHFHVGSGNADEDENGGVLGDEDGDALEAEGFGSDGGAFEIFGGFDIVECGGDGLGEEGFAVGEHGGFFRVEGEDFAFGAKHLTVDDELAIHVNHGFDDTRIMAFFFGDRAGHAHHGGVHFSAFGFSHFLASAINGRGGTGGASGGDVDGIGGDGDHGAGGEGARVDEGEAGRAELLEVAHHEVGGVPGEAARGVEIEDDGFGAFGGATLEGAGHELEAGGGDEVFFANGNANDFAGEGALAGGGGFGVGFFG